MARFLIVATVLLSSQVTGFAPSHLSHVKAKTTPLYMTAEASGARDPVKVGVIGCGRIGIVHLGAINKAPGVVPVIVSNPTISKAEDGVCYDILFVQKN